MKAKTIVVGALVALFAMPALAQTPPTKLTNVRGTVAKLDGQMLVVKGRDGKPVHVTLAPDFGVLAVQKVKLSDIKEGEFIGTAASPGKNGKLYAEEVLVFPEAARGTGEGHYPWDLTGKNDTMTNATISQIQVVGVHKAGGSRVLSLKYKDGEQQVVVRPGTPVVTFVPDSKDLLKRGAHVFMRASVADDGTISAPRVIVGKNGVNPPM
jgi:hypothetical protein